jgi:hypothetical protein
MDHVVRCAQRRTWREVTGVLKNLLLAVCLALPGFGRGVAGPPKPVVLMFIIDGLQSDAAAIAMNHGARALKFLHDHGVWVEEAYCVSPAPRLQLPDGSLPWGTASPPNVAMHTGTHVFECRAMDDIFLAARRSGIKSIFAGGALNYKEFNTADFCYYSSTDPDSVMVQHAIDHFTHDGVRLIRLHLQRLRNFWTGPDGKLDPAGPYQQYLLTLDHYLEKLVDMFQAAGVWDSTYVIVAGDHGMGMTSESEHPPSVISSWKPYMNFYGPGLKTGASIPYAESPDIALLVDYVLHLSPLQGHRDTTVDVVPRGTTGTLLTNAFVGTPRALQHPMLIRRYLEKTGWAPSDDYGDYRRAMLAMMRELPRSR